MPHSGMWCCKAQLCLPLFVLIAKLRASTLAEVSLIIPLNHIYVAAAPNRKSILTLDSDPYGNLDIS